MNSKEAMQNSTKLFLNNLYGVKGEKTKVSQPLCTFAIINQQNLFDKHGYVDTDSILYEMR